MVMLLLAESVIYFTGFANSIKLLKKLENTHPSLSRFRRIVGLGEVVTAVLMGAAVAADETEAEDDTLVRGADTLVVIGIIICVVVFICPSAGPFCEGMLAKLLLFCCDCCCGCCCTLII